MSQLEIALELTKLTIENSKNKSSIQNLSATELNNLINELFQNSMKIVKESLK